MRIGIRYAARSDVGMLREGNEDSAYAGARLLAVADGMGGHVGGEIASAAAIDTLRLLDTDVPASELLAALEHSVKQANDKLHRMVEGDPALQGMGTTLTAMLWSGSHVALVHIGDSRAYLLRGGELFQITHDHTLVQSLVDEGRISIDEAAVHPQRSLLLRALDGRGEVDPDLSLREATAGDRYLLCSDGLSGVVSAETIHQVLSTVPEPEQAVRQLIDLANRGGGPDNITCVVADVIDLDQQPPVAGRPVLAGAAANTAGPPEPPGISPAMAQDTPAQRAKQLGDTMPQPPIVVDELPPPAPAPMAAPPQQGARPHMARGGAVVPGRKRWTWLIVMVGVFVLLMAGGAFAGMRYLQSGYYIADDKGRVTLFQGQPDGVLGLSMSKKARAKDQPNPPILLADLPNDRRAAVQKKIMVDEGGLGGAQRTINSLRSAQCKWSVAAENDQVFVFQGRGQSACQLKRTAGPDKQPLKVGDLPRSAQTQVRQGIPAESKPAADAMFKDLITARESCKTDRTADCPPEKP